MSEPIATVRPEPVEGQQSDSVPHLSFDKLRTNGNQIIRDGAIVRDEWTLIAATHAEPLPAGRVIVPLARWLAERDALTARITEQNQPLGVWLDGHEDPAKLADAIHRFAVIAVNFPKFADGRGYSIATLLRSRYGFKGELRAIGDVLRDQLFYMKRVGFNAFAVRADKDIHDAVKALKDFSEVYQGSVNQPLPLFKRKRVPEIA
ncbi:MAG: DUF934 domain-containing protein [Betaproteobacteria bacterium]|nr:DUF934 domain-containing protein [Betaproteobacteria bacterium]